MRYFLLGFILLILVVVSIAGCRGDISRRPPIEIFSDMERQPRVRPQTLSRFFPDGLGSRLPVAGTIARGTPFQDLPMNTGRIPGSTNFVEVSPVPMTELMLARGRERYDIYCTVCHGAAGDGRGVTSRYQMVGIANFHDLRLVTMTDGEIFNTITYGKNLMGAYGAQIDIADRWAIIAYVRALQRAWLATPDDVPEPMRSSLNR
jgi:mono/diheme cytochrome c family protein